VVNLSDSRVFPIPTNFGFFAPAKRVLILSSSEDIQLVEEKCLFSVLGFVEFC